MMPGRHTNAISTINFSGFGILQGGIPLGTLTYKIVQGKAFYQHISRLLNRLRNKKKLSSQSDTRNRGSKTRKIKENKGGEW